MGVATWEQVAKRSTLLFTQSRRGLHLKSPTALPHRRLLLVTALTITLLPLPVTIILGIRTSTALRVHLHEKVRHLWTFDCVCRHCRHFDPSFDLRPDLCRSHCLRAFFGVLPAFHCLHELRRAFDYSYTYAVYTSPLQPNPSFDLCRNCRNHCFRLALGLLRRSIATYYARRFHTVLSILCLGIAVSLPCRPLLSRPTSLPHVRPSVHGWIG